MPGDSHVISHRTSASRDTALIAYEVIPKVAVTTGGDFAFFGFRFMPAELRIGMFGMFEFSTVDPARANFLTVPSGPYVWRGLLGYSMALALPRAARRAFGEGADFEISAAFRHESEHTIDGGGDDPTRFDGVPHIGDFGMLDVALQKSVGPFRRGGAGAEQVFPSLLRQLCLRTGRRPFFSVARPPDALSLHLRFRRIRFRQGAPGGRAAGFRPLPGSLARRHCLSRRRRGRSNLFFRRIRQRKGNPRRRDRLSLRLGHPRRPVQSGAVFANRPQNRPHPGR